VHSDRELESALADIARDRYDAIMAFADGFTASYAGRIAAFSLQRRIPAVDGWSPFAREGNLMIYGPVLEECYRRLAVYVDKIAKGARPGELPIELPTKVELVINLKTAKAIGTAIPQSVLVRADQVIQ
jgi:putative ABC transport system substrate-binding protein